MNKHLFQKEIKIYVMKMNIAKESWKLIRSIKSLKHQVKN